MRLIPLPEVMSRVQLSRATIYRFMKTGTFPLPRKLGASSRWVEEEIDVYVRDLPVAKLAA